MNTKIVELAAAYLLMDTELCEALAVALRIPLTEVMAVADELSETYKREIKDMGDAFVEFGGMEVSFLESAAAEMAIDEEDERAWRDSANEEGFNLYAEENNFRAAQADDDFFGDDD